MNSSMNSSLTSGANSGSKKSCRSKMSFPSNLRTSTWTIVATGFDIDSVLCLGISCTNELEQREAIQHLNNWLKYHPDFSQLAPGAAEPDFDTVRAGFIEAHRLQPKDTHVALALGVLSFIQRNFADAARFFEDGIRENPTDHTLWNKYGAAMANNLDI